MRTPTVILLLIAGLSFLFISERKRKLLMPMVVMRKDNYHLMNCSTQMSIYYLSDTSFIDESWKFNKGDTLYFDRESQSFKINSQ